MEPKEKAKEIFDKMSKQTYSFQEYAGSHYSVEEIGWEAGKKCALISVDEILKAIPDASDDNSPYNSELLWWKEVRHEIENL